jgi:hypothetical protein
MWGKANQKEKLRLDESEEMRPDYDAGPRLFAKAQGEAKIQPDRMTDDLGLEAVASIRNRRHAVGYSSETNVNEFNAHKVLAQWFWPAA